ncbi:elongation factor G [Delitschia confertaspora ATCC 74209]|uniref:Ribosome-releasing factor 2, mitochondrial n=1 Tax=Delitschia confertaspora ATCC 74209 TaxID=1513339 RepID=A0A9P4JR86_9PLEO|nr:elongation factor G [Delitschia confertaspora ATCC 74209]
MDTLMHISTLHHDSLQLYPIQPPMYTLVPIPFLASYFSSHCPNTPLKRFMVSAPNHYSDVDEGSTVTDFLPAERARGITIQSAAITFHWPPINQQLAQSSDQGIPESFDVTLRSSISHNINLIDTPGHADFTFEVLRSLRVLDGAVCILDGVAGVEAQTEKVWNQAAQYQIPTIIYVNKLDRVGAAFSRTVKEIGSRLHSWPAVCHIPWWKGGNGDFIGVGDAVYLRGMLWQGAIDGSSIQVFDIKELESNDKIFADEIKKARVALVELLSEHDDIMVELFLEHDEDHLAIPGLQIVESLRRVVLQANQSVVPVFAGASFRNIGVQPLLDAVVDLLPSPLERPKPEVSLEGQTGDLEKLLTGGFEGVPLSVQQIGKKDKALATIDNLQGCALAFKVVNDPKRGVLVYVRVYSGSLDKGSILFNTNLKSSERAPRLLKMYASDAVEVDSIQNGQIGVITGLKYARTGDTLISYKGTTVKSGPPAPLNSLQLRPIHVPPPVFFTSIEPNSLNEQKHVLDTLQLLLREDPSLHLSIDEESGQTHLAGMGDLHLEIARDRLLDDFKAKARIGKIEIGYRETIPTASPPVTEQLEATIAGKPAKAGITAVVSPAEDDIDPPQDTTDPYKTRYEMDSNILTIHHPSLSHTDPSESNSILPPHLPLSTVLSALHAGASAALARGPSNGFPMASTRIDIHLDPVSHIYPETTPVALSRVTRQAIQSACRSACSNQPAILMEPIMLATIFVNESSLGSVVQDISSSRGGQVLSLDGSDSHTRGGDDSDRPRVDTAQLYTPPDPFQNSSGSVESNSDGQRQITARVPLKEMVGYLNHLRSLTGGRGTFVMSVDGFERMSAQRQREVLDHLHGDFM